MSAISQQTGPVGRSLVVVLAGLLRCAAILRSPPLYARRQPKSTLVRCRSVRPVGRGTRRRERASHPIHARPLRSQALNVRAPPELQAFEKELTEGLDALEAVTSEPGYLRPSAATGT